MNEKGDVLAQKAIANWSLSDCYAGDNDDCAFRLNRVYYALLQAVKSVGVASGKYEPDKSHEKSADIIRLIEDGDSRDLMFNLRQVRMENEYECVPVRCDDYYKRLMSRAEGLFSAYKVRFRKCA